MSFLFHLFDYAGQNLVFEKYSNTTFTIPYELVNLFKTLEGVPLDVYDANAKNEFLSVFRNSLKFNIQPHKRPPRDVQVNFFFASVQDVEAPSVSDTGHFKQNFTRMEIEEAFETFEGYGLDVKRINLFAESPLFLEHVKDFVEVTRERGMAADILTLVTDGVYLKNEVMTFLQENNIKPVIRIDETVCSHELSGYTISNRPISSTVVYFIEQMVLREMPFEVEVTYGARHFKKKISVLDLLVYFQSKGVKGYSIKLERSPESDMALSKEEIKLIREEFKDMATYSLFSVVGDYPILFSHAVKVLSFLFPGDYHAPLCSQWLKTFTVMPDGIFYHLPSGSTVDNGLESIPNEKVKVFKHSGEWFSHKDCKNCWVEDPCSYCYSLNVPPSRETVLPSELFCETLKGTVEGVLTALLFLKKEGYLPMLLQKLPELL